MNKQSDDIKETISKVQVFLLLFYLCLIPAFASAAVPPWEIDGLLNKEAPSFQLVDLAGNHVSDLDLRGKVVLLNFWATWCPPCREEMPAFTKIYTRLKGRGFMILGVSIDSSPEIVKNFLAKKPVSFSVALDTDTKIAESYKVYTYPTTFLIDRHGVIQEFFLGAQDWEDSSFTEKLDKLLADDGARHQGTAQ